jgi:hypothetical protein
MKEGSAMKAIKLLPALSLLFPAIAQAQPSEGTGFDHGMQAAKNAIEVGVGTGYAQGVGKTGHDMANVEDLAGPGGAVQLELGYRLTTNFTLGGYGTFALYNDGSTVPDPSDLYGATAGVQAAWHFRPARTVDPWVKLGTGWKGLWLSPQSGKNTSLQGFELARLQLGVDYRFAPEFSLAPVVGGSLGMYVAQDSQMTTNYDQLDNKAVNFTGFAGVAGTFDFPIR